MLQFASGVFSGWKHETFGQCFLDYAWLIQDELPQSQVYSGGWISFYSDKKKPEYYSPPEPPTEEQIKAERIRLGIIEVREEKKKVIAKAKKSVKGSGDELELKTYAYLLKDEIARLQAEYAIYKAKLQAQGEQIRTAAITKAALEWIARELQQAQDEDDEIRLLLTMFAEI